MSAADPDRRPDRRADPAPAARPAPATPTATTGVELAPGPDHAVLAARQRRWGAWYAFEHELQAARAWLVSALVVGFGTPALYVLAFGAGLAALLQSQGTTVDDVDYLTFVGSALLVNGVFQTAFQEGSFPVFGGFLWRGNYLVQANAGIAPRQSAAGTALFALLRTVPAGVVFLVILALVGAVPSWGALWLIPISALLALAAALPAMAFAATLKHDRGQWNLVNRFIVMPLMLFSGTYYPLEVLPGGMQWIGWISPVWHAADLGRIVAYDLDRPGWLVLVHIAVLVAFALGGAALAARAFARRLTA